MGNNHVDKNPETSNKIIVTGAAGFIGGHVTEYFYRKGVDVTCFVKESSNLNYIKGLPIKIEYGDITNPNRLDTAFRNIDFVIHIAAVAKDWGKYRDFYNINVTGTLNVLKACKLNGIKNLIITGSISSYGEENSNEVKSEESPFNSNYNYFPGKIFPCKMNYYRNTKALATREATRYAEKNELNVTIIEPVWVYGENEFNTGFYEYLKMVNGNIPFFLGSTKNKFHVVYAGDLARAYYLAYQKKLPGVNRMIIGNSEVVAMDTMYSVFCKELGVKKPKNIPKAIVYPIGFLMELACTLCTTKKPPLLTRGRVNMFYDNIEYSTQKAENSLSFSNDYTLEEGIKRTVSWYKKHNLI